MGPQGFKVGHGGYMEKNRDMEATRHFIPPCTVCAVYSYPDGSQQHYTIHTTPVEPGRSLSFFKLVAKKPALPFKLLFRSGLVSGLFFEAEEQEGNPGACVPCLLRRLGG